ncbi:MAG: hypothetical protein V4858_25940 [Pseudomonadota bacterium]
MAIIDRISYAFLGLLFGALLGVACWWLYGLSFSLHHRGPGIDPILHHWVTRVGGAFAVLGFLFRERVGDFIGNTISAIFHFESHSARGSTASAFVGLVLLAIVIAAAWFTVPA